MGVSCTPVKYNNSILFNTFVFQKAFVAGGEGINNGGVFIFFHSSAFPLIEPLVSVVGVTNPPRCEGRASPGNEGNRVTPGHFLGGDF